MLSGDGGDELFWGYDRMHNYTRSYPFFKDTLTLRRIKKKLSVFKKPESGAIYEFQHAQEMIENQVLTSFSTRVGWLGLGLEGWGPQAHFTI